MKPVTPNEAGVPNLDWNRTRSASETWPENFRNWAFEIRVESEPQDADVDGSVGQPGNDLLQPVLRRGANSYRKAPAAVGRALMATGQARMATGQHWEPLNRHWWLLDD